MDVLSHMCGILDDYRSAGRTEGVPRNGARGGVGVLAALLRLVTGLSIRAIVMAGDLL